MFRSDKNSQLLPFYVSHTNVIVTGIFQYHSKFRKNMFGVEDHLYDLRRGSVIIQPLYVNIKTFVMKALLCDGDQMWNKLPEN